MHTVVLYSLIGTAAILGMTLLFAIMGNFSKVSRFIARSLVTYYLLLMCAVYGFIASIILRLFDKVSLVQWSIAKLYSATLSPLIGVKFEVENEEILNKVRPGVFIANHQTELDILVLGRAFPKHCSVSAKKQLKYIPFMGWFMALSGTLFIDRANRKNAMAAFDNICKEIKTKKQSIWIFPEGTRSYFTTATLLPFKKGAFHLAVQAQVPLVPIVVQNYSHVLNIKALHFEKGTIKIKILDPIETKGMTQSKEDIDKLVEQTQKLMAAELEKMGLGNTPTSTPAPAPAPVANGNGHAQNGHAVESKKDN